jgi:hypothetical protein
MIPQSRVADLGNDIRAVVAEIRAQDALVQQLDGPAKLVCQKRIAAAFARLERLQARLPSVPHTFADLVMLAELAYWWARKAPDGTLLALTHGTYPNEHFAARLIDAVLAMAGPCARVDRSHDHTCPH